MYTNLIWNGMNRQYKKYILLFDENKELICGTDAFIPLDGRISNKNRIKEIVLEHKNSINSLKNRNIYYRIGYGRILEENYITDFIEI